MTASSAWQVLSGTVGLSIDATQAKDAGGHEPHDHPGGHLTIEPDGRKLNKPMGSPREADVEAPSMARDFLSKRSPRKPGACAGTQVMAFWAAGVLLHLLHPEAACPLQGGAVGEVWAGPAWHLRSWAPDTGMQVLPLPSCLTVGLPEALFPHCKVRLGKQERQSLCRDGVGAGT